MAKKQKRIKSMESTLALRTSVSFPPDVYHTIEQLAKQRKVSVAWIIRDAAEKYIAEQWPLLEKSL